MSRGLATLQESVCDAVHSNPAGCVPLTNPLRKLLCVAVGDPAPRKKTLEKKVEKNTTKTEKKKGSPRVSLELPPEYTF